MKKIEFLRFMGESFYITERVEGVEGAKTIANIICEQSKIGTTATAKGLTITLHPPQKGTWDYTLTVAPDYLEKMKEKIVW